MEKGTVSGENLFSQNEAIHSSRFCRRHDLNMIVSGGDAKTANRVLEVDCESMRAANNLTPPRPDSFPQFLERIAVRHAHKSVYCKGELYVVADDTSEVDRPNYVVKYSFATGAWSGVRAIPETREMYCVCAFAGQIFVFGGMNKKSNFLSSFVKFDAKSNGWEAGEMSEERVSAACAVFQGRVVVSGGFDLDSYPASRHVQAYDHFSRSWAPMPDMMEARRDHAMVAAGNKLFVVGGMRRSCEVFDGGRFVALKERPGAINKTLVAAFVVGSSTVVAVAAEAVLWYDVTKDEWREGECEAVAGRKIFACALSPKTRF